MIYEIRMTVYFSVKREELNDYKNMKVTLIEYIEAGNIAEAFNKAAEYKHEVVIDIAKGESRLFAKKAWGSRSDNISISLDAVVGKPEIVLVTTRKKGKFDALAELKLFEQISEETGIPVSTLIQIGKHGYKVVKLVEEQ